MKPNVVFLVGVAALSCMTLPTLADSMPDKDQSPSVASDSTRDRDVAPRQIMNVDNLRRANQIIGREIRDDHGQRAGKIKDLALDLQNGYIAAVFVETSGTMGVHEKIVAVPPGSFMADLATDTLRFKGDRFQLRDAAQFNMSQWKQATDYAQMREAYQRFDATPYFSDMDQSQSSTKSPNPSSHAVENYYSFNGQNALPHLGYLARASKLMGTTARNWQNERLGKVDNFVVDLPSGRIVEVVLSSGGFLGMGEEYSAVPPEAFDWSQGNTYLTLNSTPEALRAASYFKASEWSEANSRERIHGIYTTYHVDDYFLSPNGINGAQPVRERMYDSSKTTSSPNTQSNNADMDTTAKIRQALLADTSLSADTVNKLQIVTADGKVTLMGEVANEQQKRVIVDTAAKFVSADKVDNELYVHTMPLYTTPYYPPPNAGKP